MQESFCFKSVVYLFFLVFLRNRILFCEIAISTKLVLGCKKGAGTPFDNGVPALSSDIL